MTKLGEMSDILDSQLSFFGGWIENHGVILGEFDGRIKSFNATIDLNQLKPAIIRLIMEGPPCDDNEAGS